MFLPSCLYKLAYRSAKGHCNVERLNTHDADVVSRTASFIQVTERAHDDNELVACGEEATTRTRLTLDENEDLPHENIPDTVSTLDQ